MGATASRSSPSLPDKCSVEKTRSTTRLFTVPDYSKCVLMSAGSVLLFETLYLADLHRSYDLEVHPAGFDKNTADFLAVSLKPTGYQYGDDPRILIEILDGSEEEEEERTAVFDTHTARSSQITQALGGARGLNLFVKRRELEASGCVRNDSFTIRCTVSAEVRVNRSFAEVMQAMSTTEEASSSEPVVVSGSHTLVIHGFSKLKAALLAGECVHSTQFSLGGSSWYFKVYPNGRRHYDEDVSFFLGRGRSHEQATTAEFCFEIADVMNSGPGRFTKCTFHHNSPEHEFPYHVTWGRHSMDGDDDRIVVRCHLRVIKVTTAEISPYQRGNMMGFGC